MARISRRALLVQTSLAAAAMCMNHEYDPDRRKHRASGTATEGLLLTARITQQDARALHLEWTLVNSSHEPVVVLRHLFDGSDDFNGNPYGNPDVAYVSVRDDWTVDVSKMYDPVSLNRRYPCFTPVPHGDEVAAGDRITETFTLRVPVMPYDPYASRYVPDMVQGQGKAVVFHLGVYRPERAPNLVETANGKLIFPPHASLEAQVVLEAPAIPWSGAVSR